jgi:hypothetical protein
MVDYCVLSPTRSLIIAIQTSFVNKFVSYLVIVVDVQKKVDQRVAKRGLACASDADDNNVVALFGLDCTGALAA